MTTRPISTVLIANRGEIAVRIARTLRTLGIRSVLVSTTDAPTSLAAGLVDEVVPLDGMGVAAYLDRASIVRAALHTGADAVHPGYGFLSEDPEFARAVEDAGLAFIGPSPESLARLGDKVAARRAAADCGVGSVPGSPEPVRSPAELVAVASTVGFPLLIKAAAGGGGRGIRVAWSEDQALRAFEVAGSEARAAFGRGDLFVERFVAAARHIEIQVIGDGCGGLRVFAERDCSIQRRLQKLVEESPAAALSDAVRERLWRAAFDIARAAKYRGAGTFEFLVGEDGEAYFLEVNPRIQVEHPVTEMVSGIDLVAEQLRIASGESLPIASGAEALASAVVPARGAAIELRLNAEDPLANFRPVAGRIEALSLPAGPGVRVDAGYAAGHEVRPDFDPLLAKIIAGGPTRELALSRLDAALREVVVAGVPSTLAVGRALLRDEDFRAGRHHCGFLEERIRDPHWLAPELSDAARRVLAAGAALIAHGHSSTRPPAASSPRHGASRWLGPPPGRTWELEGS